MCFAPEVIEVSSASWHRVCDFCDHEKLTSLDSRSLSLSDNRRPVRVGRPLAERHSGRARHRGYQSHSSRRQRDRPERRARHEHQSRQRAAARAQEEASPEGVHHHRDEQCIGHVARRSALGPARSGHRVHRGGRCWCRVNPAKRCRNDLPLKASLANWSASPIGWIAQLVEQRTENPRVAGSIPAPATSFVSACRAKAACFFLRAGVCLHSCAGVLRSWRD